MLAEDFGYHAAFGILDIMSLVTALLYLFIMQETLPNYNEQFIGMLHKHNNYKPNNSKPINPILSLASINGHHKEGDAAMEDHEFHWRDNSPLLILPQKSIDNDMEYINK